jgi:uncharacterized protein YbjT (DUF2867 family)
MPETILVIGATGMLGEPVARHLASDGFKVRVMCRSLDRLTKMFDAHCVEAVEGDVEDVESLSKALEGCSGVHLNLSGGNLESRGAENVSRIALEKGVKRISVITGATTCEENAWFPATRSKLQTETAIKASGIPYTIFRCTMFMESMPKWIVRDKIYMVGGQPTCWHWIAAEDYAMLVSKAFVTPEAANKTLYVYGPEQKTIEEALTIYTSTFPTVKLVKVPFWWARILSWMPDHAMLRKSLPMFEYLPQVSELGDAVEANSLLGEPTITVKAWCVVQKEKGEEKVNALLEKHGAPRRE